MNNQEILILKEQWVALQGYFEPQFGEKPDLQTLLFLIGVQELGKGPQKFNKDQKVDLMHIAVCKLLSAYGYYELTHLDEDGWPQYKLSNELPPLSVAEQDVLLKKATIKYFEELVAAG